MPTGFWSSKLLFAIEEGSALWALHLQGLLRTEYCRKEVPFYIHTTFENEISCSSVRFADSHLDWKLVWGRAMRKWVHARSGVNLSSVYVTPSSPRSWAQFIKLSGEGGGSKKAFSSCARYLLPRWEGDRRTTDRRKVRPSPEAQGDWCFMQENDA